MFQSKIAECSYYFDCVSAGSGNPSAPARKSTQIISRQ